MQIYIKFMLFFFTLSCIEWWKMYSSLRCYVIFISHPLYFFAFFNSLRAFKSSPPFHNITFYEVGLSRAAKREKRWKINRFLRRMFNIIHLSSLSSLCSISAIVNWFHFFVTCSSIRRKIGESSSSVCTHMLYVVILCFWIDFKMTCVLRAWRKFKRIIFILWFFSDAEILSEIFEISFAQFL